MNTLNQKITDTRVIRQYDGLSYHANEVQAALASAGVINMTLLTPAASQSFARAQLRIQVYAGAACRLAVFEATTVSANGTARTLFNRLRATPPSSQLTCFVAPTITGDGTQIDDRVIPAGVQWESPYVLTLAPATRYLIRVTNIAGPTAVVGLSADVTEIPSLSLTN